MDFDLLIEWIRDKLGIELTQEQRERLYFALDSRGDEIHRDLVGAAEVIRYSGYQTTNIFVDEITNNVLFGRVERTQTPSGTDD